MITDILNDIVLEDFDPEKEKWDALIDAAMSGNVVPVIGPDILCDFPGGKNLNEFIIASIAKALGLSTVPKSFSQLMYDEEFLSHRSVNNKDTAYALVNAICAKYSRLFQPSDLLRKLLSIKVFPFVITTSYSPVVEDAMRATWGARNVNVLAFCNNPAKDRKPGVGDIASAADMTKPTVYYMFGKVGSTRPHSYVLSDQDMLAFCKSWLSDQSRPANLCKQLENKYLLMLGCGYGDWLFRFIWYCMNKREESKPQGLMAKAEDSPESLVEFLNRIETFLPENKTPIEIVSEIERRVAEYNTVHEDEWFSRPPKDFDVFISYSRSDGSDIAEKFYRFLTHNGLRVWYDRANLAGGANFMSEIDDAISNSKVFLCLITPNIAKEAMDSHVYRKEWKKAIELQDSMSEKRRFIIPMHTKGFDFYEADIPKELKKHNSIEYDDDGNGFQDVLRSINESLNFLDTFKSKV